MHDDVERDAAPGVLARMTDLLRDLPPDRTGAVWRLDRPSRQLDANLVRLPAGAEVAASVESDLDVLLFVTDGSGRLETTGETQQLRPGAVVWLPRGSRRALAAGEEGLVYLTAHRRRPGLMVRARGEGGEAPCMLHRLCAACGRMATETDARFCNRCGERLPVD
ncbi:cupin domain-containing protein [Streptomyces sp. NPDC018031]|uniref:cupin domain-containing protein n=1 Tax=Streptomyces sp. NPDC018031 TaxID=3365033 RepID=UPI0037AAD03A